MRFLFLALHVSTACERNLFRLMKRNLHTDLAGSVLVICCSTSISLLVCLACKMLQVISVQSTASSSSYSFEKRLTR